MKTLIMIIALTFAFTLKAQDPDPDIFNQNWYLYEIYDSDLGTYFYVEGYQPYGGDPMIPQISPYVIIDESFNFNGLGICNTFEGTLEYDIINNNFRTVSVTQTNESCGFYEDMDEPSIIGPFGYVDPDPTFYTIISPQVTDDSDGFQTLRYGTQPFVGYTYRNTPILGVDEFEKHRLKVFPNPVKNLLNIQSEIESIDTIVIFDATGKRVTALSPAASYYALDTSSLPGGLYFLEISTTQSKEIYRIVKE